jgi:hypothetical protein
VAEKTSKAKNEPAEDASPAPDSKAPETVQEKTVVANEVDRSENPEPASKAATVGDVSEIGKSNPEGDTVAPPEMREDAVTAADVAKVSTPDEPLVARRLPRERQHPSLTNAANGEAIEVSERSSDVDTALPPGQSGEGSGSERTGDEVSTTHVKTFVTTKREWDSEDHDAVHERNKRAVRQYMVNQGIRPTGDVVFMDETVGDPVRFREDLAKVTLRYGVTATPAVIAVGMEQVHVVIDQNGPSATELAQFQAQREQRILDGRAVVAG